MEKQGTSGIARNVPVGVAFILLLNIVVFGLYLWSRSGQTTVVRVEAVESTFSAYIDGALMATGSFANAPSEGQIVLGLDNSRDKIPSLPERRGIDSVIIRDLPTGEIRFEDSFDSLNESVWRLEPVGSTVAVRDGVLSLRPDQRLKLVSGPWSNLSVEVRYKGLTAGTVFVRSMADTDAVAYQFRPFKHFDNGIHRIEQGKPTASIPGKAIDLNKAETLKGITAIVFRPYLLLLFLLAVGCLLVLLFQLVDRPVTLPVLSALTTAAVICALGAVGFALTLFLLTFYGARMPHVPDEVAYIFQAKVLASGHVAAPPPPDPKAFSFFYPDPIAVHNGHWAAVVPFGHPLALAAGEVMNAVWLIPPLIGGVSVLGLQLIALKIYRRRTALLAGCLLVFSPFFLMTASNFMSHNTAAFYLIACVLCLAYIDKRPYFLAFLAGVCFGLLFNTRPLTAVALAPCVGLMLVLVARPFTPSRPALAKVGCFIAGGLCLLAAYLLYNYGTTGNAFVSGYQATGTLGDVIGFGGRHTINRGVQNELTQLTFLVLVLNGWPARIGMALVMLPFILGTRKAWDWLLLFGALSAMAAYSLFESSGIMHGPRYWYEALPFLILLTARGAERAVEMLTAVGSLVRRRHSLPASSNAYAVTLTYGFVVLLIGYSTYGWLLNNREDWRTPEVPGLAKHLKGFNGINDLLVQRIDAAELENALVLVETCTHWHCYGNVFWLNSPTLDGNIVYAADIPEKNLEMFAAFPARRVYQASYSRASLKPYGAENSVVATGRPALGPFAGDLWSVHVAEQDLRNREAAIARDEQRLQDLRTISTALEMYAELHGSYPITGNIQSLCTYPSDVGCGLMEVLSPLPRDPSPGRPYWYQSNGQQFTLYSATEELPHSADCPSPLPSHVAGIAKLSCLSGRLNR